ncbi:MAG TPA: dihydrofolate reductase family protein, partial [Solirubrobacteraceae bacterium]|nr:dihydrofolate reductase family protein [Solirubrobacteraceae bacterium]
SFAVAGLHGMTNVIFDISMSLDGYVAGPDPTDEDPLGRGGELLHEWLFATRYFNDTHGTKGGGDDNDDSRLLDQTWGGIRAEVMGRGKFSGGSGPWEADGNARGWWGDEPPFHYPVFVLTRHPRDPLPMEGGTTFTFVSDGIESALDQARTAAGDGDVLIGGGAAVGQQYLKAGLVDAMHLHIAPVFLGGGRRLFEDHTSAPPAQLERTGVVASPSGVVHVSYRR